MRDQSKRQQASSAFAHVAVEVGKAEVLGEQFAVDVGEGGQGLRRDSSAACPAACRARRKSRARCAEVGAVRGGAIFEVELESVRARRCRCPRRTGRTGCGREAFELVPGVAAGFQGVVEVAQDFGGLRC